MTKKMTRGLLVLHLLVCGLSICASTQTDSLEVQGLVPWGSYQHGDIDSVNMMNGMLVLHIPLHSLPQRGRLSLSFSVVSDTTVFRAQQVCQKPPCYQVLPLGSNNGPTFGSDQFVSVTMTQFRYPANSNTFYNIFSIVDSTGASHPLGYDNSNPALLRATDGSGFLYAAANSAPYSPFFSDYSGTIYYPDGIQQVFNANSVSTTLNDPDGNSIVFQNAQITDTLGRTIPAFPSVPNSSIAGCPVINASYQPTTSSSTWTVPGPNGAQLTYLFCYASATYRTNFFTNPPLCGPGQCQEVAGGTTVLQSIVLPNGTYWAFIYDSANPKDNTSIGYAQVQQIKLPEGGTISYHYTNYYQTCRVPTPNLSRAVSQRTLDPGNGPLSVWKYNFPSPLANSIFTSPANYGMTATDPLGNDTVYTYSSLGGCDIHETKRQSYQGSQANLKLLRTKATAYQNAATNPQSGVFGGSGATIAVFPSSVATTLDSGQVTTSALQYNDGGFVDMQPACTVIGPQTYYCTNSPTQQIPFGRATSTTMTDYGGAALRTVQTQYQQLVNSAYKTANFLDLVASSTTYDGSGKQVASTTYGYDENNGSPQGIFGHQTSVLRWLNTTGKNLTTSKVYNTQGMISQIIDANLNPTKYTYDSTGAFLSQIQYPDTTTNGVTVHHSTTLSYDANSGLELSSTDQNRNLTSRQYDTMGRPTQVNYPDQGQITYCYTDVGGPNCAKAGPPYQEVVSETITSSLSKVSTLVTDGFGRLTQKQLNSDPEGVTFVDTTYDALGRKATVSNPHRSTSSTTDGIITYGYDALGRVTTITQADGTLPTPGNPCPQGNVCTTYYGNQTTVTDEAAEQRKTQMDALGRLTSVWEDPSGLNYETDYIYDAANNLVCVQQQGGASTPSGTGCAYSSSGDSASPWRIRRFQYDSLSRLTQATNPESGTISYNYDANGNVLTKVAPQPDQANSSVTETTNYSYDALNRLTQKSYVGVTSPTVLYWYDGAAASGCTTTPPGIPNGAGFGIGHRTAMCDGSGATSWSYDKMGRVLAEARTIVAASNVTHITQYSYNLDGSLQTLRNPSNITVLNYTQSGAGRTVAVQDSTFGVNYVTNVTYAPGGEISGYTLGGSLTGQMTYNNRLQPLQVFEGTNTPTPGSLQSSTCPATVGNIMHRVYDFHAGTGDNGNVWVITNCRATGRTQNFSYDKLNRIAQGYTTGSNWGEIFTIDAWGNLTNRAPYPGKTNYEPLSQAASNQNQLTGFGYDAAGNMTSNGTASYSYDAENRITGTAGWTYVYDGDGKRVIKCNGSPCSTGTLYWTGIGPDALAESTWNGAITFEYVFLNGKRTARRNVSGGAVQYFVADHLGSTDVITSSTGSILKEVDYFPYGGEIVISGSSSNNYKFTGKERDSESGLDYFIARHYASSLGRFMQPDEPLMGQDEADPQSLNLYSYVRNNPLNRVDPDGRDCVYTSNQTSSSVTVTVERGACSGDNGTYISGTIDMNSFKYNGQTGELSYSFSDSAGEKGGVGVIALEPAPGQLNDFAAGVFSQPVIGYARNTVNNYIAPPLLTFLSFAVPGALSAAGPSTEASLGTAISASSKAAARQAVEGAALSGAQKAAVKRAIARATASEKVSVERLADGSIRVLRSRPGADGYQVFSTIVDGAGNTRTVQTAVNSAGEVVHYDPK